MKAPSDKNHRIDLPARCHDVAESWENKSPYDMEVYNVLYEDCDTPWVICRHKDAPMSIEKMIDNFGRLPVRLRNLVRVQLGTSAAPSPHLFIPWCAGWDKVGSQH
jgi:hypothetical protein